MTTMYSNWWCCCWCGCCFSQLDPRTHASTQTPKVWMLSIKLKNRKCVYCFVHIWSGFWPLSSSFLNSILTTHKSEYKFNNSRDNSWFWLATVNSVRNCYQQVIESYYSISSAMMQLVIEKKSGTINWIIRGVAKRHWANERIFFYLLSYSWMILTCFVVP